MVEFSGLFSDSPDKIFITVFGQSGTRLRFGFDPRTDVLGFCSVFWYPNNSVTNREGAKRCLVLCGSEIWAQDLGHFVCYCCKILNNMLFCAI